MSTEASSPQQPQRLDASQIAARVPHSGPMCLLQSVEHWNADELLATATSHLDPLNPLLDADEATPSAGRALWSCNAIEYAAQAMALHGALTAPPGQAIQAGFLASARQVQLHVQRLDTVAGAVHIHVQRLAAMAQQAQYAFTVSSTRNEVLVQGRATVVLNTHLP